MFEVKTTYYVLSNYRASERMNLVQRNFNNAVSFIWMVCIEGYYSPVFEALIFDFSTIGFYRKCNMGAFNRMPSEFFLMSTRK